MLLHLQAITIIGMKQEWPKYDVPTIVSDISIWIKSWAQFYDNWISSQVDINFLKYLEEMNM